MATLADLQHRISAVRSKERNVILVSGLCKSLVAFVLTVIGYFLIDWVFDLPYAARLVFAASGLAIVGYVVFTHLILELQRIQDDDEIALRVEARNTDLRGRLISTLQLTRAGNAGAYVGSPELIAALEDETVRMSEPLDFYRIVNTDKLVLFGVAAAMILVIKIALVATMPDYFQALGMRLIKPNAHFPTKTRIKEIKVPPFVPRGEDIAVEVLVDGESEVPNQPGVLYFQSIVRDSSVPVELLPQGGLIFKGTLAKALEDVNLTVNIGDARSEPVLVRVLPRPEVDVGASGECIKYKLPAYTKESDPPMEKFGGISALIGSTASISFVPTKPLSAAVLERSDGTTHAFTKRIEKVTEKQGEQTVEKVIEHWELPSVAIDKMGSFHVTLTDVDGLKNSQPPVEYPIDARPDNVPSIKLVRPSRDVTITPMAKPTIVFNARDDWNVRMVWLVYRVQSEGQGDGTGEVKRVELKVPQGRTIPNTTFSWEVSALNVKVGEQIIFWLEADDDCTTNDTLPANRVRRMSDTTPAPDPAVPQKVYSRSNDIKLSVISREEKALELQAEVERLYQLLLQQKENQEELKVKVRLLIEELQKLKAN